MAFNGFTLTGLERQVHLLSHVCEVQGENGWNGGKGERSKRNKGNKGKMRQRTKEGRSSSAQESGRSSHQGSQKRVHDLYPLDDPAVAEILAQQCARGPLPSG